MSIPTLTVYGNAAHIISICKVHSFRKSTQCSPSRATLHYPPYSVHSYTPNPEVVSSGNLSLRVLSKSSSVTFKTSRKSLAASSATLILSDLVYISTLFTASAYDNLCCPNPAHLHLLLSPRTLSWCCVMLPKTMYALCFFLLFFMILLAFSSPEPPTSLHTDTTCRYSWQQNNLSGGLSQGLTI